MKPNETARRCVWLTPKQRKQLGVFFAANTGVPVVEDVIDAWDAAPADPERVVGTVLHKGHPDPPCQACEDTIAVLKALGWEDTQ